MIEILTATCGGFLAGWFCRALVETRLWFFDDYRRRMGPPRGSYGLPPNHDWRRSFTHENHNAPSGPPPLKLQRSGELGPSSLPLRHDEGSVQRGNGNGGPTTPKPEIVPKGQPLRPARIIIRGQVFDIRDFNPPRFHDGTPNPPPTEP